MWDPGKRVEGFLFDLDGTVYQESRAIPGAADDLESDIAGARASGMIGVAVRTGKYRPQDEERARQAADAVLDSVAGVPGWMGI